MRTPNAGGSMPSYIALCNWTEQGVRSFNQSVDRYEAARAPFEQMGVTIKDIYWTLGAHDLVFIAEAPDDETLAAALLSLGGQGNLRTTTLRAFAPDEMRAVISKIT
jgi:uncharacterized protein with GYD domain